ncbi:MAG: tRNA pseudouridine(55) synthase TruB, partial [Nitrospirae bacterium RBG_19FT_COMBO_42_15]
MDGFLVINKQKSWTSADVVNKIKRVLKIKKAGHLGTLDPDATGVLPIALGKATKVIRYINEGDKEYQVVMKLGEKTDTLDAAGKVIETKEIPKLDKDKIEKILKDFTGKISQTPPAYSAVKVDGVRAYELARKGKDVQIKPRDIIIKEISLTKINIPFIAFNVVCSKGTYIRSLCSDIGERLGTAAHMFSLIRSASGQFKINDAVNIDDLGKGRIIKIDEALGFM